MGSLLQISRNALKADGDNQGLLASISPSHCSPAPVSRNDGKCWNPLHQPLLLIPNHHPWNSPATAALLNQQIPSRDADDDFRQTSLQAVQRFLILSFELSPISFSAEARAQQSHSLISGNCGSSLICLQGNFHRAWHWCF